jgi:hypothetical protein
MEHDESSISPIIREESSDSESDGSPFSPEKSKQKYDKLGKSIARKILHVRDIRSHWEVSDEIFNSVKIDDSISDDILLAAAQGTFVQWAPCCYNTQSRSSKSKRENKNECNCIVKLLPKNTFQPPDHVSRGFVQAHKNFRKGQDFGI